MQKKKITSTAKSKTARSSVASSDKPATRTRKKELTSITGMRDILPQNQKHWERVRKVAQKIAANYGFGRIDTPILEQTDLFARGVGQGTDIVEKEMFSFVDLGGDSLSLRPEATASVVRAYIQHGMLNQSQPVKVYYEGPMFRHEKPQSGRFRQFFQFGYEAIGEINPAIDAQIILMGYNSLNDLGIESMIQVNSIGCPSCRKEYKENLVRYYKEKNKLLCESCKKRLTKNPLRLLDCKEDGCSQLRDEAPQILDHVCDECKDHFMKVVEYLDELDLPYVLNPYLVRGLDYYTKTVFEYWGLEDRESKSAFGGGGRYDPLAKILGAREETPGIGLAMGMDRIVTKLNEKNDAPKKEGPDLFVAQLGEAAKKKMMVFYEELRKEEEFSLAQAFHKDSLRIQLELANKLKAKFTLILGQKEISEGTILIRDMDGGVQEVINFDNVKDELRDRLKKHHEEKANGVVMVEADKDDKGSDNKNKSKKEK